jgi:hypothetical protein
VQVSGVIADTAVVEDPETTGERGVQHERHGTFPMTEQSPDQSHWWVECADPFGRCRAMNVLVHRGRVVVVAPPGQAAVLSAHQTRLLGSALAKAAESTPGPDISGPDIAG